MAKDIVTKAEILGGEIDVRANFGQTVKVTVSPDPYMGDTEVTPSAETQVLATKKKFVQDDITVNPAPVEGLLATSNGQFTPSDGKVGFYQVDVDVNPDLRPLSVSENGTYQPDGFDGYSDVTVDVPQKWDVNLLADGTAVFDDEIVLETATRVRDYFFDGMANNVTKFTALKAKRFGSENFTSEKKNLREVILPECEEVGNYSISVLRSLTKIYAPKLKKTTANALRQNPLLSDFDFTPLEEIGDATFADDVSLPNEIVMPNVTKIGSSAFIRLNGSRTYKFGKKATSIASNAFNLAGATDIYVPWSQGEVANAPWGATNATIHYNTVYDENWNVISST